MAIRINGEKLTNYRINYGKKYSAELLGSYKSSISGQTIKVTAGDFITEFTKDYKAACKLYNKSGADAAAEEAKQLNKALWGQLGWAHDSYLSTKIQYWQAAFETGVGTYGAFKDGVGNEYISMLRWAIAHPVEYVGGEYDMNQINLGNTGTYGSGNGSNILAGIDVYKLGMYAAIAVAAIYVIKLLK